MLRFLSMCDGVSCGLEAIKELGLKVVYDALEIDPAKRSIADHNHPEITRPGHDVVEFAKTEVGYYDFIICGFTCKSLSSQGGRKGWDGSSKVFFDCLEIVKKARKINPKVHIFFENVASMGNNFRDEISEKLGVPHFLGLSALVSGQDRKRLYWFDWEEPEIKDRGIMANDCLDPDGLYLISFSKSNRNKKGEAPIVEGRTKNNGKAGTLVTGVGCTGQSTMNFVITKKMTIRYLRVSECARLQGMQNYKFNCTNEMAFKAIGDAWTVPMIVELFKACPKIQEALHG